MGFRKHRVKHSINILIYQCARDSPDQQACNVGRYITENNKRIPRIHGSSTLGKYICGALRFHKTTLVYDIDRSCTTMATT